VKVLVVLSLAACFWQVYRVIDGRAEVEGHGTREIPIWERSFGCRLGAGAR
jgi:hypothetical protein